MEDFKRPRKNVASFFRILQLAYVMYVVEVKLLKRGASAIFHDVFDRPRWQARVALPLVVFYLETRWLHSQKPGL